MSFLYPDLLFLLLGLPVFGILWYLAQAHRRRRLKRFADPSTWGVLAPGVSGTKRSWKSGLLLAALALSIVAASRPLLGTRERDVQARGLDIVLAIDVSRSMLAEDVPETATGGGAADTTRLAQAKRTLRQLLAAFPGQRFSVLPFAGDAFVRTPLTSDYGIALRTLMDLDPGVIQSQGTDIGRAIQVATQAFKEGGAGSHVLVLVTDGEDHGENALEQAQLAAEAGVRIYTLGIGSAEGGTIEIVERDPRGAVARETRVQTRLDVETLAAVAEATGGATFVAPSGKSLDVRALIGELEELQTAEYSEARRVIREERFQWPLALAIALLLVEGLLGEQRGTVRGKRAAAKEKTA
ncbi:MAG: VWA domain-containing protein [Sumerlaeia bacterium]